MSRYDEFITFENGSYWAWDETQSYCIGEYSTRGEAVKALVEYAKELSQNPDGLDKEYGMPYRRK